MLKSVFLLLAAAALAATAANSSAFPSDTIIVMDQETKAPSVNKFGQCIPIKNPKTTVLAFQGTIACQVYKDPRCLALVSPKSPTTFKSAGKPYLATNIIPNGNLNSSIKCIASK